MLKGTAVHYIIMFGRRIFRRFASRAALLGIVFCILASAWAMPAAAQDADGGDESPFDNLAVVLVIDVSGSMEYTDPLRLRETAAGMFIDLLGADDYLGVITFDHEAELIEPLGPVGSRADKEALMNRLSPKLDHRGDTDFIEALELAREQFDQTDTGDKVPVIFMLTDGEPDPYPGALGDEEFMAGYMEELWELIGELAEEELMIYSVAFSDEIDPDVMQRIASETRGLTYILDDPSDLLVTFYEALEILKDRRGFLDETVDLGEDGTHTFSFRADEAVRQVNLVLVGSAEEDEIDVTVEPPDGSAPEEIGELLVGGRDNYKLIILSRPKAEHFGEWAVEVAGSGTVQALGNADLYLEAVLMDPDREAFYPVGEPLDLRVEVITREKYEDEVFELAMEVASPDDTRPLEVPMQREGNSFIGVFDYVHRTGDYELEWKLLREGRELITGSAVIMVRDLPGIKTDFWAGEEGFRLGEEIIITASLESKGTRMQEGAHLQVDRFSFDLEYRDGARIEGELFDSGSEEHGNVRKGDGIWSNRVLFDREGTGEALMSVAGAYRGDEFVLRRSFGFTVSEPGSVTMGVKPDYLWSRAGDTIEVPLELVNRSSFTQTLRFTTPERDLELLQDRVSLAPGEEKIHQLMIRVDEALIPGLFAGTLEARIEEGLTELTPEVVEFDYEILSAMGAFRERYGGLLSGAGLFVIAGVFFAGALFGGGSLLNRFYLAPRLKMSGRLVYRKEGGNPHPVKGRDVELDLGRSKKRSVVISFGAENPRADYAIPECEFEHDMVITNRWNDHLPGFLRGWKALFARQLMVEAAVKCTPPGVLVTGGKVLTSAELQPEDEFEAAGLKFRYEAQPKKGTHINNAGKDILDGKS